MTRDENEKMTRVGPGTPGGEMLRRYWWPIMTSADVTDKPVPVQVLGEDLILFRDGKGQLGLLERHCAHRSASLEFGRVEADGIRCCYHGWKYAFDGACIDQMCEPNGGLHRDSVRQKAYAARDVSGFVFAYMGPLPVPTFPQYDLLMRENCRKIVMGRDMHSNWLQRAENMQDALHLMCLHGSLYPEIAGVRPDEMDWKETWYGIQMDLEYPTGISDRHHYVFPACNRIQIARVGQETFLFMQWVTPKDDVSSVSWQIWASESESATPGIETAKYQTLEPGLFKRVPDGWWDIWERDQDDAAVDSQGRVTDRTREHLATSDRGIVLMRRMVAKAIDDVASGRDPTGVVRPGDPHDDLIDLTSWKRGLDAEFGQVRQKELGEKLKIVAPHDF